MPINETVLEMHYHRPLMDLFKETFGLGPTGAIQFYKYSPRREVFIGFDQAYVRSELTDQEFFHLLSSAAQKSSYALPDKFVGYFLQFKVVAEIKKPRINRTPASISARPHYRASLSTTKDAKTGHSQHELLFQLAKNAGAMVYYACPMLFEKSDLYVKDIDLDCLQLPELASCPSDYADNDKHSIYFNDRKALPVWCSEPVEGKAESPKTLASLVAEQTQLGSSELAERLRQQLLDIAQVGLSGKEAIFQKSRMPSSLLKPLGDALTVVRVSAHEPPRVPPTMIRRTLFSR